MTLARIFALSGVPTFSGSRTCDLAYGFVNLSGLNITRIPLSMEWIEDEPYEITSSHTGTEWFISYLSTQDVDSRWAQNFFSRFRISYIIEDKDASYGIFVRSLQRDKDCVYDNGEICFWKLGGEEV